MAKTKPNAAVAETSPRKKMKKKTKITLFVLLGVLIALIAVALIVYFTSPFPMALRFRDAVEKNDNTAFYDCIDPNERVLIRRTQMATGASLSRLVQYATNTTELAPDSKITYRLTGYRRADSYAYLTLRASVEDGTEWDAELVCVNRNGTWYVAVGKTDSQ